MVNMIEIIGKTTSDGLRIQDIRRIGNTEHFIANVKNIHSGREEWLNVDQSEKLLLSLSRDTKCKHCSCCES